MVFQNKNLSPVIIFDSGVGGISVYQAIKNVLPGLPIIYCADSQFFPYGRLSQREIVERTKLCFAALVREFNPAVMVLACNTASTVALPALRQFIKIPIVGVVPAIKVASQHSKNRVIGLLSTQATAQSAYIDWLVGEFASDCEIIKVGSNLLVTLAENYFRNGVVDDKELEDIIKPFINGLYQPDVVVLGCTHFPILKPVLQRVVPSVLIKWVDSGTAVARRVQELVQHQDDGEEVRSSEDYFLYTGEKNQIILELDPILRGMGFQDVVCFRSSG